MENPETSSKSHFDSEPEDEEVVFTGDRSRALLQRFEREREEARKRRQAGRPKGELSNSLIEKLRSCNVPQLRNVKKLCDRHIARHLKPPSDHECGARYTIRVLASIPVKNECYRLEFDRSSLKDLKVYAKGPYVRCYWWDGDYVKARYVKKDKSLRSNLPKKVWMEFRSLIDRPENETLREQLTEELRQKES
jgi:hypothetical protein